MTTQADRGGTVVTRVDCSLPWERNLHLPIELALRDMRKANGRNQDTGEGRGNDSWIGACLGMIVLDTLSGTASGAGERFRSLLTGHEVTSEDAKILWGIRNALLHGYGVPKSAALVGHRKIVFTDDHLAYALDTAQPQLALFSVPVFCGHLVERIAAAIPEQWDRSLIQVDQNVLRVGRIRTLPPAPS